MAFVLPHCPACETTLAWLNESAAENPTIRFQLITVSDTPSLRETLTVSNDGFSVAFDGDALLASVLAAYRAPTVYTFYDGQLIARLDWPFTEEDLSASIEDLALGPGLFWPMGIEALLERDAPDFTGYALSGETVTLSSLPTPLILAFLSANCPYCVALLPELLRDRPRIDRLPGVGW